MTKVNVDNFARAETDRLFTALSRAAGPDTEWTHYRAPTPLDNQTIIRMNRDTLCSYAIVNISDGATITIPDAGDRYVSVMVVNQDHYINSIIHAPGTHRLTMDDHETPFVMVAARILVAVNDPEDVAAVNALQDRFAVTSESSAPFVPSDYDQSSTGTVRRVSTASLPSRMTMGRSRCPSPTRATTDRTACRSWRDGTTSFASTDPTPRSSAERGRSRRSKLSESRGQ